MTGVVKASCADDKATGGSFPEFVATKEVLPNPSSPPMMVHIHRKPLKCHCHSYEEIKCTADGSTNALYDEHIAEITEHCKGVLDGTVTDCPYKCFQPFEVLHLHYMECSKRKKDPLYLKIDKTDLCHQAARPPAGSTCDEATTSTTTTTTTSKVENDVEGVSVAAAGLMLAALFVQ